MRQKRPPLSLKTQWPDLQWGMRPHNRPLSLCGFADLAYSGRERSFDKRFRTAFSFDFGLELRVAYCVWRVACCVAVRCVAVRVALRAALRVALRRVACCVCVALRVA